MQGVKAAMQISSVPTFVFLQGTTVLHKFSGSFEVLCFTFANIKMSCLLFCHKYTGADAKQLEAAVVQFSGPSEPEVPSLVPGYVC